MKNEEVINVIPTEEDKQRIVDLINMYHKAGIDTEKVKEYGVTDRISFLICAIHALHSVAYRLTGKVNGLFDLVGARRHAIKKALIDIDNSMSKFLEFFKDYQSNEGIHEMNKDVEHLYHQYMKWCMLPEEWKPGDPQSTQSETSPMVTVVSDDNEINIYREVVKEELLKETEEKYCVTRIDPDTTRQYDVVKEIDKASVQMVAKRMSVDDKNMMYTASKIIIDEKRTVEVLPLKVYSKGELVGDYRRVLKSNIK